MHKPPNTPAHVLACSTTQTHTRIRAHTHTHTHTHTGMHTHRDKHRHVQTHPNTQTHTDTHLASHLASEDGGLIKPEGKMNERTSAPTIVIGTVDRRKCEG
jgi:hypothetical protein